jgi:hypothetical protein
VYLTISHDIIKVRKLTVGADVGMVGALVGLVGAVVGGVGAIVGFV